VTQSSHVDAVVRDLPSTDLDHRDPLPVAALELGHAGDVDLLDRESELRRQRAQLISRPLAEVAVAADDQPDARDRGP
jgi:hypothetical protein